MLVTLLVSQLLTSGRCILLKHRFHVGHVGVPIAYIGRCEVLFLVGSAKNTAHIFDIPGVPVVYIGIGVCVVLK